MITVSNELWDSESNYVGLEVCTDRDIESPFTVKFGDTYRYFNQTEFNAFIKKLNWMKKAYNADL